MAARLTFATADLKGCSILTDNGAEHSLRFGSDLWAQSNAAYHHSVCVDDLLPASVYFAELERSWSAERFNTMTTTDAPTDQYTGVSFFGDNGNPYFNDSEADERELPIAQHFVSRSVFGTAGFTPKTAASYMDVCDRGIAHVAPTPTKRKRVGRYCIKTLDRATMGKVKHTCNVPAWMKPAAVKCNKAKRTPHAVYETLSMMEG